MVLNSKKNQLNILRNEIEAKENALKSQQYLFERELLNGLGEEINYTLSHPGINNKKQTKIEKIKQLRQETGVSLREIKDALDYSGWDMIGAKNYIQYGW